MKNIVINSIISILSGVYYNLLNEKIIQNNYNNYINGSGILSSFVSKSSSETPKDYTYLIVIIITLIILFLIPLILKKITKKNYISYFKYNYILIIGIILSALFIYLSTLLSIIFLVITILTYLIITIKMV